MGDFRLDASSVIFEMETHNEVKNMLFEAHSDGVAYGRTHSG